MQEPTDDMSTTPEETPKVEGTPADEAEPVTEAEPEVGTESEPEETPAAEPEPEVGSTLAAGTRVLSHDEPTADTPAHPHGLAGIKDAFSRHRAAFVLLAVGAVAVVLILVVAGIHASNLPPTDVIESDATSRLATPSYDCNLYGNAVKLTFVSLEVSSRTRTETAITSDAAQFGASGYASADVTAIYKNASVTVTKTATLGYAKVDGSWIGIGTEQNVRLSYEATAGVDQSRMLNSMSVILGRADQALHANDPDNTSYANELSLVGIYGNASVTVADEEFDADAQTDTVKLELKKSEGFGEYDCELTVHFAFRAANGIWEIDSIDVSNDAKTLGYNSVVGTWTGTFQSQETDGTKCLAASSTPLEITVSSYQNTSSGARLTGTISGVAHFHDHPGDNADSCDGDTVFSDVKFTATIDESGASGLGGNAVFVATLPEMAGGTVSVTLGFGTSDDPDAVVAVVETLYQRKESFLFVQYDKSIGYKDTYVLQRTQ